ncbi:hypothetical protein D3C86_804350 [compost metagenome]
MSIDSLLWVHVLVVLANGGWLYLRAYGLTLNVTHNIISCFTTTEGFTYHASCYTTQQGEVQHRGDVVNPLVSVVVGTLIQYQTQVLQLSVLVGVRGYDSTVGVNSLYYLVSHLQTLIYWQTYQHLLQVHLGVTKPRYSLSVCTNLTLFQICRDGGSELLFYEGGEHINHVRQYFARLWVLLCNSSIKDGLSLKLIVVDLLNRLCEVNTHNLLLYVLSGARGFL